MPQKLTLEQVRANFTQRGWTLLSDSYEKNILPLKAICPKGHETTISWCNLKKEQGCGVCARNQPFTFEQVKKIFEDNGYTLLEKVYVSNNTPMNAICQCGSPISIRLAHVQIGNKCQNCKAKTLSETFKTSDSKMAEFCQSVGCQFVKSWIDDRNTRIAYVCKCGNETIALWCNFQRFPNCKICGSAKISGDKCHMYDPDREAVAMRKKFRKMCGTHIKRFMEATDQKKTKSTHVLLGYKPNDLKDHILNHPDYQSVKDGVWHVDHIFPIQAFLDHNVLDLKIINALENLRPISGDENLSKSDKYDKEEFLKWLADIKSRFALKDSQESLSEESCQTTFYFLD